MKNQVLETVLKMKKRMDCYRRSENSFTNALESNALELEFLKKKFGIDEKEALLLAASCIVSFNDSNFVFDIDDLSRILEIDILEFLLYQKYFQNLIEKGFLTEHNKQGNRFSQCDISILPIFNKEYALHSSLAQNFI